MYHVNYLLLSSCSALIYDLFFIVGSYLPPLGHLLVVLMAQDFFNRSGLRVKLMSLFLY